MIQVQAWVSSAISFWIILLVHIQTTDSNYCPSSPPQCPFKPVYPPFPIVKNSGKCVPPPPKKCDPNSYYYSYDGSCNNLKYPQYGQAPSLMDTFLKQQYSDNYNAPRKMSNGKSLPLPRLLTLKCFPPIDDYNTSYNTMYYGFSQFTTHDCSYQVPAPSDNPCCVDGKPVYPAPFPCYPCEIPPGDPFYGRFGIECLENTRSVDSQYLNCTDVKPVQAMNYQTPALDLSFIYGANYEQAQGLRAFKGGLLKTNQSNNDGTFTYPAQINNCSFGGLSPEPNTPCYVQGDNRTLQNAELTMQYLYWFSCHNAICKELIKLNPSWNDEKLYQECRRISIAFFQHCFYAFISANIGMTAASKYGLLPKSSGYRSGYTDHEKMVVMNEMSSTCGRHGHSSVRGDFITGIDPTQELPYKLAKTYFGMGFIQGNKSGAMRITKMFTSRSCQRQDNWIVQDLNNLLFSDPGGNLGSDLSCIDVIRGREYGQPGYNEYRKMCGLPEVKTWSQFYNITSDPTVMDDLMKLYATPQDADLYTMGLLEKKCDDSPLGPTFTCMLGAQYWLLIYPDRLWYDFPSAKFTMAQLKVIRQITIATILCVVFPSLDKVPKNAFYIPSKDNPLVDCKDLRKLFDLSPWKEPWSYGH